MKTFITKIFSWIKDHFLVHFVVFFRLHIGHESKESNPDELKLGSNPGTEDTKTEKGS